MKTNQILATASHRPWLVSDMPWRYYQEWHEVIFLHWKVDRQELEKYVPSYLTIDLFAGEPWVSIVAFTMKKVRPRYVPAVKLISQFHELNLRTYVKFKRKTGVYFLSIEASKLLTCRVSNWLSGLPYRFSRIHRNSAGYDAINGEFNDKFELKYSPGNSISEPSSLDRWLTERYALFQNARQGLSEFEIHHVQWPLKELRVERLEISYPRFGALLNGLPDLSHYSEGVQTLAWGKIKWNQ